MNLVADEGVDKPIVDALRQHGFSVLYFAEYAPSSPDTAVLAISNRDDTLLLTCDKDFGELVFRQHLSAAGVVLIRLQTLSLDRQVNAVVSTIHHRGREMLGAFSVISPGILRIRTKPAPHSV